MNQKEAAEFVSMLERVFGKDSVVDLTGSRNQETPSEAEVERLIEEHKDTPYNGIFGDSCDCVSCNVRRLTQGVDQLADCEKGLTAPQSRAYLIAGYGGENKLPDSVKNDPGFKDFEKHEDLIAAMLSGIVPTMKALKPEMTAQLDALIPGMRAKTLEGIAAHEANMELLDATVSGFSIPRH